MGELEPDPIELAHEALQSFKIDLSTPVDRALLLEILGLQIHDARQTRDILERVKQMAVDYTALLQAVQENTDGITSAITLIEQLAADNDDPAVQAQVDSVTGALTASNTALSQAVTANTPVEPTPAPAPSA